MGSAPSRPSKPSRTKKNPEVDTTFLPDKDREEREKVERERLKQRWLAEQEIVKAEPLPIAFSFYNGSSQRSSVTVKKGDTVHAFLDRARQGFVELRGVAPDNLIFIKEDLIIPHVRWKGEMASETLHIF